MGVRRARITPAFRPCEAVLLSKLSGASRAIPSTQSGRRKMASASAHNTISQSLRHARSSIGIRSHDAGRSDSCSLVIKQRKPHKAQKRSLLANSRVASDCHTALLPFRRMLMTQICDGDGASAGPEGIPGGNDDGGSVCGVGCGDG